MKKVFILLTAMVTGFASLAQLSAGILGTGNLNTAHVQLQDALDISKKMKLLPGGGFVAQYDFSEKLGIRTGLHYLQNGATVNTSCIDPDNGDLGEIKVEAISTLHYLQVPLNILYFIPAGKTRLYVGTGPFANYGISGKTKLSGTYTLPNGSHETVTDKQDAFK